MMTIEGRRDFLKLAAGSALLAGAGGRAIAKALAAPAHRATGTIRDVEHVVILMQENRSFDHYFGSLRGVRGFGDPRPLTLPSGRPVWFQPKDGAPAVTPFHMDGRATSAQVMDSLDHSWKGSHERWKRHDAWIVAKTPMTMGYFRREDLPFYYALADAFTVCDAYHCSVFGPTNPNRLYLFTGTSGLTVGQVGPLAVINPPKETNETADMANDSPAFEGFGWTTYAERLQAAGVRWKVYQEHDNYGDNALAYFKQYRGVDRASPLYARGRAWAEGSTPQNAKASRGEHLVAAFARDVAERTLPQVSWIVAPYIMCEHPAASPGYGETLTARLIEALADHPEVWSKTVFILNYDENDGFFDHMPPPLPAVNAVMGASTTGFAGEDYGGEPMGLGPRVPMLAISPWSKGGWVNSEVFDHTSVIRFLEARFGVREPNISPWRRAVCGDLTSAFDFRRPDRAAAPRLPDTSAFIAQVDATAALPRPVVPAHGALPAQEPGHRPARPLPYSLQVHGRREARGTLTLTFVNDGTKSAAFNTYSAGADAGAWFYTVGAGRTLAAHVPVGEGGYDLSVFGPNGFLRRFRGGGQDGPWVEASYAPERGEIVLVIGNPGSRAVAVTVRPGAYPAGPARTHRIKPGGTARDVWSIAHTACWYDLALTTDADPTWMRQLAGHVETGRPSLSDPAIGMAVADASPVLVHAN